MYVMRRVGVSLCKICDLNVWHGICELPEFDFCDNGKKLFLHLTEKSLHVMIAVSGLEPYRVCALHLMCVIQFAAKYTRS